MRLLPSDIPIAFDVRAADGALTLMFAYQQGMDEPRKSVRMDRADCETGVHSRRLFSLTIRLDETRAMLEEISSVLRKELRTALKMLHDRTVAEGARMNYRLVEAGLVGDDAEFDDDDQTPAWMNFALERLRDNGPASGSGRPPR